MEVVRVGSCEGGRLSGGHSSVAEEGGRDHVKATIN